MDARAPHRDGSNRSGFGHHPGVCPGRRAGRRNWRIDRHRQRPGRRRRHRAELAQRHQPGAAAADIFGPARRLSRAPRRPRPTRRPRPRARHGRRSAARHPIRSRTSPIATSSVRPPATIPLVMPEKPNGSLVFLKGCWRTDIFADGPRKATHHLVLRRQGRRPLPLHAHRSGEVFYCHALAQARGTRRSSTLSSAKPDLRRRHDPRRRAELTCRDGTDGALCTGAGATLTVRLYSGPRLGSAARPSA